MNFLSYVLAVFLLGSTLTPCADIDDNRDVSYDLTASDDGESHLEFNFCAPLCSCQCCQSHVVTYQVEFPLEDNIYSKRKITFSEEFLHNINYTFWHPPKTA